MTSCKKLLKVLTGMLVPIMVLVFVYCLVMGSRASGDEKMMPDEMKELVDSGNVEWMAGIWVELTNCARLADDTVPGVDAYETSDRMIYATVTVQNGLNIVQPYYLMVFADGIPVAFEIGGALHQSYPIDLTCQQTELELEFQPEFSLNLGRLDFLLFYNANLKSDYHMTTYTVFVGQDGDSKVPSDLMDTLEQRDGLVDSFRNGTYGAWLWNQDALPLEMDNIGSQEITTRQGEQLLLEVIASGSGLYRTVLILDGKPVSFVSHRERHTWLDWESHGTDMLQIPVELVTDNPIEGSFFTVSTPLGIEAFSRPNLASVKILLHESEE